jgi:hypothetical protein
VIDDRFDRLASLFLGDHEPTPTAGMEAAMTRASASAPREAAAVITPLVAGNLPVLAHPWLWHVAARLDARPTALLRLAADGVQAAMLNAAGPADSERSDLAAWLLEAATVARRWFVVPRSGGEIDTVSALEAEEAVVVTGGDEAATVAAYQWVRRLVEAAKSEGRNAPLTPIAVVGCDEAAAREAAATVSTMSQSFLGQPVPLAGVFPKLERTAVTQQRFYGETVQPSELLAAIRTAGAAAWARKAAPSAVRSVPPRAADPAPVVEAAPSVAASPVPAPLVASGAPETLASCVPGLWPVSIRCPGHRQVEFATDESGRLHLLVPVEHAAALRPAHAWAQRHAGLLRAGFPGLAADPLPLVERLVFMDATRAVEWHHAGMRLDLLVRSAGGWMHVPLNDERSMQA